MASAAKGARSSSTPCWQPSTTVTCCASWVSSATVRGATPALSLIHIFFTRGTTRNPYAQYSERGPDYIYNMERLIQKFQTAATLVPQPVLRLSDEPSRFGVIYYGSTTPAMREADVYKRQPLPLATLVWVASAW